MSGSRITFAAVGVALVLGAATWGWNTKLKPRREKAAEEAKKIFPGLQSDELQELMLRKRGSDDVLLRRVDGRWMILKPIQAPADQASVAGLVAELAAARRDEVVVEAEPVLHEFGLDQPSGAVTFLPLSAGAKSKVLFFGIDHPLGTQAFALVDGTSQVFLTALSAKTALLKDAAALRDKAVWGFDPDTVKAVKSGFAGGAELSTDAKGYWQVKALGRSEPAKGAEMLLWLGQLAQLKALSVPSETGMGKFGLQASKRLQLTFKDGKQFFLALGGKAAGGGTHAQVGGQGPVYVLADDQRAIIEKSGKDLMDLQAFSFKTGEVERFEVERAGKKLTAAKKLGAWAWESSVTRTAGAEFDFAAFLSRLANTELIKRLDRKTQMPKASTSVTLYGANGVLLEKAEFGPRSAVGQVAVSRGKDQVCLVAGNLLDGLPEGP